MPHSSNPTPGITIRDGNHKDLSAVAEIYAIEVRLGSASFELEPPDEAEIACRFNALKQAGLPYLVAQDEGGQILGFAYAGPYRTRPAYGATVENSVYVTCDARGRGVGRALLAQLIERCRQAGKREMVAVIGDSANLGSIALHRALGFREIGVLQDVGRKHGRWLDSVLMQRRLHDETDNQSG